MLEFYGMTTVPKESEKTRRRTRTRTRTGTGTAVFFFGIFILILVQLCVCSGKEEERSYNYVAPSRWSPARKARFINKGFSFHADSRTNDHVLGGTTTSDRDDSYLYEDEKRLVHTGPNPLHN